MEKNIFHYFRDNLNSLIYYTWKCKSKTSLSLPTKTRYKLNPFNKKKYFTLTSKISSNSTPAIFSGKKTGTIGIFQLKSEKIKEFFNRQKSQDIVD